MAAQLAAFVVVVSMLLEFSHCHDQEIKYGYEGEIAPEKWGNLSPAFQACSKGKMQSPIDIDKNNAFANHKLGSLKRDYIQANATLVNNGASIGILWSCGNGFFSVDGKNYTLKESIWHTPSEHTFKGKKYAVELQHIHRGDNEQIVVVVSLYKEGDSDSFHDELKDALATLSKETCSDDELAQIPVGTIDSGHLTRSSHKYYRYRGSLTVPPCTENVNWFIISKVRELSKEQIEALKAPLNEDCKSNARPIQPLNARQPHLYSENSYN
ncbi:hypothetical protein AAC387_Pa03g4355 [Persea americana]